MIVNKTTMLVENWGDVDQNELWIQLQELMRSPTFNQQIYQVFSEWSEQCGLNDRQELLVMSTLFPMRMMESLILSGFTC